ncbi:MAG: hypothetical protein R3F60_32750 [bacterium]
MRRCEGDLDRARQGVARAWQRLDELGDDRQRDEAERDRARARWRDARDEAQRRRDRLTDAERALDAVAPTQEVPRMATHRYALYHARRRCAQEATMTLTVAGDRRSPRTLAGEGETRDRHHAIQVPLGLDADPLRFPVDDDALRAGAAQRIAEAVAAAVEGEHRAWALRLGQEAVVARDPAEADRLGAAALLLAPGKDSAFVAAWLKAQRDLPEVDILYRQGPATTGN